MAETLSVADVLERAADRCAVRDAWCQGASQRDQFGRDVRESRCVPTSSWMLHHFAEQCAEHGDEECWNVGFPIVRDLCGGAPTAWNDAPERTQAEVVAKLREAAAKAREQGL